MMRHNTLKLQSAMEYLMTYGWAILIIAVVLGALFALGVFTGGAQISSSCQARAGYICQNPTLGTNGNLTFTFAQSSGANIYNIGVGCTATATSGGYPNPTIAMVFLSPTGAATTVQANVINEPSAMPTLVNNQAITVTGLKCFNAAGNPLTSVAVGTAFSGSIWINFTISSGSGQTMLTYKVGTLITKAV